MTSATMAQDPHADDRQMLLQMLTQVESALNGKDFTPARDYLLPTSVVVFQDTTVATGPAEIEAYFERMLGSAASVLSGLSVKAQVDAPATFLNNNTAVAYGHTIDTFEFRTGNTMDLYTAWTATLTRDQGRWYVALLHFSNDLFDNPVLNSAKRMTWIAAVAGLLLGMLLLALIRWLVRRRV